MLKSVPRYTWCPSPPEQDPGVHQVLQPALRQDRWAEQGALQDSEDFLCADPGTHGTHPPGLRAGVSRENLTISWPPRIPEAAVRA